MEERYKEFEADYKKLNKEQKDAVDSIDGPVMVVAGPGTGKTQILALRIANILKKTDTHADGILCLTFTNSAVKAMRERLRKYIGAEVSKVKVSTFHAFGMEILEKYFMVLGLDSRPELMDEKDTIALCDDILQENDWEHIKPRGDVSRYFRDLKSMISLLKRERISPEDFETKINEEIKSIKQDPASISSRGESKGELKKDIVKKIEGLERSLEAMKFYELYEAEKKNKNVFDYDDILEALNNIIKESEEAQAYIKENFLYVLVDEHQDSSGVQNEFLESVWKGVEKPNIFVVGDDRQLIYGFGGASLDYFKKFESTFGKAKQIFLTENYRSTQNILESAHSLLQSSMNKGKLKSNHAENHALRLVEAYYSRDEIIACGLEIKDKIQKGLDPNEIAILVPKNRQVRSVTTILKSFGIPVAAGESQDFFESPEAVMFLQVLKIIASPEDGSALANSFFNKLAHISPFKAHEFIKTNKMREFSLMSVQEEKNNLFDGESEINKWIIQLKSWLEYSTKSLYDLVQKVGAELLLDTAENHEELVHRIEIIRTVIHLIEHNSKFTLKSFIEFMDRVEAYGENIPLAVFAPHDGVKVLTLHGSKGLEFDFVWIAHMDEKSFSGGKIGGFTLPESIKEKVEVRDEEVSKRQLYVAITRAKRFCTISYALKSYSGGDQELAHIVADIAGNFEKQTAGETEKIILQSDAKLFAGNNKDKKEDEYTDLPKLVKLVARDYEDRKVSVSLLNNFFECPWKWYFRNLLQLPEPQNESLQFGNIAHSAIDQILKLKRGPKEISQKELEEFAEGDKLALKIISKWVETRLGEISSNREAEQGVSVVDEKFPRLHIYGKIDLIEKLDSAHVRVTDFKTGGVRKKSDIEKIDEEGRLSNYMRQLAMYSYLIKQSPKWKVSVSESRLEFLEAKDKKEEFYNTVISAEQIEMIRQDIADYDELLKTGEWINRPCNYNSYGKNTECEYCKMAEIYK